MYAADFSIFDFKWFLGFAVEEYLDLPLTQLLWHRLLRLLPPVVPYSLDIIKTFLYKNVFVSHT